MDKTNINSIDIVDGKSILEKLVENKININIIEKLLSEFEDVEKNPSFLLACSNGQTDIVKLLLDKGANINIVVKNKFGVGYTALMIACLRGHTEIVDLLLEKGANINEEQIEVVKNTLENNNEIIVKLSSERIKRKREDENTLVTSKKQKKDDGYKKKIHMKIVKSKNRSQRKKLVKSKKRISVRYREVKSKKRIKKNKSKSKKRSLQPFILKLDTKFLNQNRN